jgi:hypothetical protein
MEGCDNRGSHRLCARCEHAHVSRIRGEQQDHAHAQQKVIRNLLYINLIKNADLLEKFYFGVLRYNIIMKFDLLSTSLQVMGYPSIRLFSPDTKAGDTGQGSHLISI